MKEREEKQIVEKCKSIERTYCWLAAWYPAHVIYVLRFPCRQWTCGNTIYRVLYGRWLPVNYYAIYSPCTLPPRVYGYPFKALTWDAAHERERLTELKRNTLETYCQCHSNCGIIAPRRAYRSIKILLLRVVNILIFIR